MGGGDLNMKKSWHPVLLVNQERVWKAEKQANEEKKKLAQLRKEQEEERQLAELQRMQEASTGRKRVEKLDWMYSAPSNEGNALGGARIGEREMEDYLLGKRRVDEVLAQGDKNVGSLHKEFIAVQNANSARDTASKIREDPLLAIKRQEQAALAAMANRPDIRRQLKALKKEAGESKEERRARKKAEKAARHESKRHRYRDSRSPKSEYTDEDDKRRVRDYRDRDEKKYRARSRSSSPRRDKVREEGSQRYRDQDRRYRDESPGRRVRNLSIGDRDSRNRSERDERRDSGDRSRDRHSNGHSRDDRIPPPRQYPTTSDSREVKPHPSRPSAMDLAERPTSSRPSAQPPASNGNGNSNHLDEMRAARLAAMSQSATELYAQRTKTLSSMAQVEKEELAREERMRTKYGQEHVAAGFFKQKSEMGLGENLARRAGKGLQRDI
ncbi:Pre-mRNA splicing factor-domain-containing protein [Naematelia encephala]|uniref:Pre-mRNA splicing factor-domain-containing protein n=1 Tax=Naematelia encephala TaxID=71784 RepID=A0A1Y2B9B7_9TREE|nr:Pre-mRNA splicing factor-domain-containing protein [Naematelia encephala]